MTGAILIGNSRNTYNYVVADEAATFTPQTKGQRYVIYATVDIQLAIDVTADATSFYLQQGTYVEVRLLPSEPQRYGFVDGDGDTLSYICATGADNGTIFITEIGG
ncbi:MAG TPA: hypothetical protein VHY79_13995 [Rhizomicrobium sp.]|jgi:hypothetical protein|nr:hypothetical protein [Rhizomicrobium sp.]